MNRFSNDYYINGGEVRQIDCEAFLGSNVSGQVYAFLKRTIDIIFSIAALAVFSPLFLIIPIVTSIESRGPAIIRQRRVGMNGKIFGLYKFRSMKGGVGYDFSPIRKNDKRITRTGKFLRKTGIDEIPQFINVLKGDMSIVGPRPEMEFIVEKYNALERKRLLVKPGITGLWQIKANRRKLIHENIGFDLDYIENRSIYMDLAIMAETAIFMIKSIKK
jgi:lipopolysaccharide/colanic/teichoic acid biosynthesis glycosyltransferase